MDLTVVPPRWPSRYRDCTCFETAPVLRHAIFALTIRPRNARTEAKKAPACVATDLPYAWALTVASEAAPFVCYTAQTHPAPTAPPASRCSASQRHARRTPHHPGGVSKHHRSRFGLGGRAQGGCGRRCLVATILRSSRPTTSPRRGAAPHHADASRATPSSWSGFRSTMHAPATCRSSSLRSKQAKTHHREVAITRDSSKNTTTSIHFTPIRAMVTRMDTMMGSMHTGASWNIADAELYPPNWAPLRHVRETWHGLEPTADSRRRPRPTQRSSSAPQAFMNAYGR